MKETKLQKLLGVIALAFKYLKNIVFFGNITKYLVSGQFKKTEKVAEDINLKYNNSNYFDCGFYRNRLRLWCNSIDVHREELNEQIMTYIICGKFNNNPFLMVDCVATNRDVNGICSYKYVDKLIKLISPKEETFVTLTGQDTFLHAINIFDNKCHHNNINFDFEDINHINEIFEIYKLLIVRNELNNGRNLWDEFGFVKIFFVTKSNVKYYVLKKDIEKRWFTLGGLTIQEIENNKTMECKCGIFTYQFKDEEDVKQYCKDEIKKSCLEKYGFDLKDRFSFIIFKDDKQLYEPSAITNEELVSLFVGEKYDDLKSR